MRIENIANKKGAITYELDVIGTEQEVTDFGGFTKFSCDFIEEEGNDEWSITIMGTDEFSKEDFRHQVVKELKEYRKIKNK